MMGDYLGREKFKEILNWVIHVDFGGGWHSLSVLRIDDMCVAIVIDKNPINICTNMKGYLFDQITQQLLGYLLVKVVA